MIHIISHITRAFNFKYCSCHRTWW